MRLIVFSGLSGSGKSTVIAREFRNAVVVEYDDNAVIVEYDDIRKHVNDDTPPEQIMRWLFADVGYWLSRDRDVVVDAVNVHPHDRLRWEAVAWAFDLELEWREIDTPLAICIERDLLRDDPVGRQAIEQQAATRQITQ